MSKQERLELLKEMDGAEVGTKIVIKSKYTKGPAMASKAIYTKVSNGGGVNYRGIWEGCNGQRSGLAIVTKEIKSLCEDGRAIYVVLEEGESC